MKFFITAFVITSAAGAAMAQEATAPPRPQPAKVYAEGVSLYGDKLREFESRAKVVAEFATANGFGMQKNSPLSAEELNESVQTLADGNRISHSSTSKFYRNSEGRIRREGASIMGGMLGTTYSFGPGVSIVNPVIGQKYLLDSQLKTARVIGLTTTDQTPAVLELRAAKELAEKLQTDKRQTELKGEIRAGVPLNVPPVPVAGFATTIAGSGQAGFAYSASNAKYDTRNEELGTRDFEGVLAEGTRRTTTIPAGAIGNERPIEIVYERWFSKDLGMVVYSKNNDPRFGEQTYKLTNIVRSEPDPSLFAVPSEYKKLVESGNVYRIATAPEAVRPVAAVRPISVTAPAKPKP